MGQVGSSGPWSSSRHCHREKGVSSPYGLCERISILSPLERTVGRIERACPPRIIYSASRRSVSLHLPNTHPRKHEDAFASLSNSLPKPTRRCLVSSKVKWEAGETQADIFFSREVSRIFTSQGCPSRRLLASPSSPLHTSTHTIFNHRTILRVLFSRSSGYVCQYNQ